MFSRIEEVLDYSKELIEVNKGVIGLNYVAYGSDPLLPKYPACVVAPGETQSKKHGTHYFMRTFYIEILILHAKLSVSRAIRTREDLEMVTSTVAALSLDPTCGGLAMFSFVTNEVPQNIRGSKAVPVIGTQITWEVEARVPFR